MKFWKRLRYYIIGVGLGVLMSFFFFQNRGCGWLPGNRVLNTIGTSMILRTDSVECLMQCNKITDEDFYLMLNSGKVLFSESQTQIEPKMYVIQGTRKADGTSFKMLVSLRDTTSVVEGVSDGQNCDCRNAWSSDAKIMRMPDEMVHKLFLEKELSLTSTAKCHADCLKLTDEEIKDILYNGKIDYAMSFPLQKPHAVYVVEKAGIQLEVELTESKTRITGIPQYKMKGCGCQ